MIAPGQSQLRATEVRRQEPERPTIDVETAAKAKNAGFVHVNIVPSRLWYNRNERHGYSYTYSLD